MSHSFVPRFFDVTQDNVPPAGAYDVPTLFTGGFDPAVAHTAGQSASFASTTRRFGNAAARRDSGADCDGNKLEAMARGPGYIDPLPYDGFEALRPEVAESGRWGVSGARDQKVGGVQGGTFSDLRRRLTADDDECDGLAGPGSYELGSPCFDRACSPSLERSGIGTSSFENSSRKQALLPDATFVRCQFTDDGSSLSPVSYDAPNENWRHWRDSKMQLERRPHTAACLTRSSATFAEASAFAHASAQGRRSVPPRERLLHLHGGDAHRPRALKGRRPRRVVAPGTSALRSSHSQRRGTFFGLYDPHKADDLETTRQREKRAARRKEEARPEPGSADQAERIRDIRDVERLPAYETFPPCLVSLA
eukprot:g8157.t1